MNKTKTKQKLTKIELTFVALGTQIKTKHRLSTPLVVNSNKKKTFDVNKHLNMY